MAHIIPLVIGCAIFLSVLGWRFALGQSPYFIFPQGDIATEAASFFLIAQDQWRWPWLDLPMINMPEGANALFMGGIPLVALITRIWTNITNSTTPHILGLWYLVCYMLQAHSFFFLMRQMAPKALILLSFASAMGVFAFTFLTRFGHMSLMGQFLVIYAAGAMIRAQKLENWVTSICWLNGLNAIGLLIFPYFSFSISFLIAAALINLAALRKIRLGTFFLASASSIIFIVIVAWSAGLFHAAKMASGLDITSYAALGLNLGAMVVPWGSPFLKMEFNVLPWWEGTFYLGLGTIGLLVACAVWSPRNTFEPLLRALPMIACLCALTIYCLSNEIRFGEKLIFSYALPNFMTPIVGLARAGGRLFWPVGYLILATGVVTATRVFGRWAYIPIGLAVALSAIEALGPISHIHKTVGNQHEPSLKWDELKEVLRAHTGLRVFPSFWCNPGYGNVEASYALWQISYEAAVVNIPTNNAITVRRAKDCNKEADEMHRNVLIDGDVDIFLTSTFGRSAFYRREEEMERHCGQFRLGNDMGLICSRSWETPTTSGPVSGLISPDTTLPTLVPGIGISFSTNGNWRSFAGAGWSPYSDDTFTWTVGTRSRLQFRMPNVRSKNLQFEIFPLVGSKLPTRSVDVRINGRHADTWIFQTGAWTERTLFVGDLIPSSRVEIEFLQSFTSPARDIGLPGEDRELGIGIKSALLHVE